MSSTMPASAWSVVAASLDREEQLAIIDLNVRALTELSLAFVDSLQRHRGGILNVGSVAGFCRVRARRSITPARLTCCRCPRRRCTAN